MMRKKGKKFMAYIKKIEIAEKLLNSARKVFFFS